MKSVKFGLFGLALCATHVLAEDMAPKVSITPITAPKTVLSLPAEIGGRIIYDKTSHSLINGWPGTYFISDFHGQTLSLELDEPQGSLKIEIDGKTVSTLTKPGLVNIDVTGMSDTDHTIRLVKLSETGYTFGRFYGLSQASKLAPIYIQKRLEFIGDSFSVGYGNQSAVTKCSSIDANTDSDQSYGALIGKALSANYQINAFSGKGVIRNYNGGDPDHIFPSLYDHLVPVKDEVTTESLMGYNDKPKHLIFIGLGTNDFSRRLNLGEKWSNDAQFESDFIFSYVRFVHHIRDKNKGALIILTSYENNSRLSDVLPKVVAQLKAQGDDHIDLIIFPHLALGGCDGHPNLDDHRLIASTLLDYITAHSDKIPFPSREQEQLGFQ